MSRHTLRYLAPLAILVFPWIAGCKEKPEVASEATGSSLRSDHWISDFPASPSGTASRNTDIPSGGWVGGEQDPFNPGGPNFPTAVPADSPQATPLGTPSNPLMGFEFNPGTGGLFVSEVDPATGKVRVAPEKAAPGSVDEILSKIKVADQYSPSVEYERMWVQARNFVNKNQLEEALTLFGRMRQVKPNDPRVQVGEGIVYLRRQEYHRALGVLELAVRADPNVEEAYGFLAQAHMALDDPAAALNDYAAVLRLNPNNFEAMVSRLNLLFTRQRYADMIPDANKLIALRPNAPEGYIYRAVGYLLTQRVAEGQRDFLESVRLGLSKDTEKALRPRFFPVVP